MKNPPRRCPFGFTLTELLVVIVMTFTLVALSFMGLRRMREAGDRAATASVHRHRLDRFLQQPLHLAQQSVEGKSTDQRVFPRRGGKTIVGYYDGCTSLVIPDDIRAIDAKGGQPSLLEGQCRLIA